MIPNVSASIRLAIEILSDTPIGSPYKNRTPAAQHAAKANLLTHLSQPYTLGLLEEWSSMSVSVDDNYQETVPFPSKVLIQGYFDIEAPTWPAELGHTPIVGDPTPGQICAKLPTCGHDCLHAYRLKKNVSGTITAWKVQTPDNVEAHILAIMQWTTPAAQHVDGGIPPSPPSPPAPIDDSAAHAHTAGGGT